MPSADLWPLAQQGNPQALETIFKMQNPEPSWVVKVRLHDNCLQVLLEAEPTPDKQRAVALVQSFLAQLQPLTIASAQTVRIWGRRRGQLLADWVEDLAITPYLQPPAGMDQDLAADRVTAARTDMQEPERPAVEPDAIAADVTDSPDLESQGLEPEAIAPEFTDESAFADELAFTEELAFTDESAFTEEPAFADELAFTEEPAFTDEFTDVPELESLALEPEGGGETLLDTLALETQELEDAEPESSLEDLDVEDLDVEDLDVEDLEEVQEPEISALELASLTDEGLTDEGLTDESLTDESLTDEGPGDEIAGDRQPDDLTTALLAELADEDGADEEEALATQEPARDSLLADLTAQPEPLPGVAALLTGLMAQHAIDGVSETIATDREREAPAPEPQATTEDVARVQASEASEELVLEPETVASESLAEELAAQVLEEANIDDFDSQATEFSPLTADRIEAMELEGQALELQSVLDPLAEDWQPERQGITAAEPPEAVSGPQLAIAQPQLEADSEATADLEGEEAEWFLRPEIVVVVLFALFVIIWQTYEAILEEVDSSDSSLSSSGLARRLNTTRRTINRMKKQPDFSQWSQSRDPDAIAWVYGENGRFTPILTPIVTPTDTPT